VLAEYGGGGRRGLSPSRRAEREVGGAARVKMRMRMHLLRAFASCDYYHSCGYYLLSAICI
jgi:hypothetical protein